MGEIDCLGRPEGSEPETFGLPGVGAFHFSIAGTPARLIAVERGSGLVYLFSQSRQRWNALGRGPSVEMPPSSFAASGTRDMLVYPGGNGVGIVSLRYPTAPILEAGLEQGDQALGGAIRSQDIIYLPIRRNMRLQMAGYPIKCGSPVVMMPVVTAPEFGPNRYFGAPVRNAAQDAMWIDCSGYLIVHARPDGHTVEWRRWHGDFTASPAYRPYRSLDGAVWQLGLLKSGEFAYHRIIPQPNEGDIKRVEGPFLSAGSSAFRSRRRYSSPWQEEHVSVYPLDSNAFMLPLLTWGDVGLIYAEVEGRSHLVDFIAETAQTELKARLYISEPIGGSRPLWDQAIGISRATDLSLFAFGGYLYCYVSNLGVAVRWRLERSKRG